MKFRDEKIQNNYLTGTCFARADERRYGKTGTSLRLTTKGNLALIKTDEYGCGKNKISFGSIGVHLRVQSTSLLNHVPSFDSINLYQCPSLLKEVLVLGVAL